MPNEQTIHTPTVYGSGVTPFMTRYAMTYDQVKSLLYDLNDNSLLSMLSQLYSDHIDNIISLYFFPFDVVNKMFPNTGTIPAIEVSTATLPHATGYRIDDRVPYQVGAPLSLGQVGITPFYNNFLDYAPYTKIEIFLPFIGFETLDTDMIMGKTIKLRYVVDLYTGKCTAYIIMIENSVETVIMTRDGQCGVPIQVAGGSGAELARNMLRAGANILTSLPSTGAAIATGNMRIASAAVAESTVGTMDAARTTIHKGGQQSALTSGYAPLQAYLIYTRPVVNEPTSYAHTYGRPCGKTLTLSTLTGYTQVDRVHVGGTGFEKATTDELNEIERLLKTGVIL